MKKIKIYKTLAIIDPNPNVPIVSSSKIKHLTLFEDGLRLGREDILYDQMLTRRIQDGCIHFWDGKKIVRFAIQGSISKGSPDNHLTTLINNLINAIHRKDNDTIESILRDLNVAKRAVASGMVAIVGTLILVGAIFGIFWESFLTHPKYLWILLVLIGIGPLLVVLIKGIKFRV